jgi:membrane-bound inhibitor of C-type lysozyme
MKILRLGVVPILFAVSALPAMGQQRIYHYECASSKAFQVEFTPESAQLTSGTNSITLPRVISGSGARYSNGQTTLYTKGNEAFLEEGSERTYTDCVGRETASAEQTITALYQCSDNRSFTARYLPESAELVLDGHSLTLPQIRAASGARYSDGETTLFIKGNEAYIEVNGETVYEGCLAQTSDSTTRQQSTQTTQTQTTRTQTNVPQSASPQPASRSAEPVRGMW